MFRGRRRYAPRAVFGSSLASAAFRIPAPVFTGVMFFRGNDWVKIGSVGIKTRAKGRGRALFDGLR